MNLNDIEMTSLIWLLMFALTLVGGLSLVWTTLRTGMSPMPSSRVARAGVLMALEEVNFDGHAGVIIDLGSGWGHLAIAVARRYPNHAVKGYELAFLPWLFSVIAARLLQLHNLRFLRRDFLAAYEQGELADMQIALTYLHGPGMARLQTALIKHPGNLSWLISNNFAMPGWQPEREWQLQDFYRSPLYLYSVKTLIHQKGSDCTSRPVN